MKIEELNDDHLVLTHRRWKAPLVWTGVALFWLAIAMIAVIDGEPEIALWLTVFGVITPVLLAIQFAYRSQLVLDSRTGTVELRYRTYKGYKKHRFALENVQGVRVGRVYRYRKVSAAEDPHRYLNLFVKAGMDEGRYRLTKERLRAQDALEISSKVNSWMRPVRRKLAKTDVQDTPEPPASLDS